MSVVGFAELILTSGIVLISGSFNILFYEYCILCHVISMALQEHRLGLGGMPLSIWREKVIPYLQA